MGLVIRVPRRLRSTRRFVFDDDVEKIVIGRDPDRSDIMFPPRTQAVGLEHLALKRVLGRYRLVLNADDPVFVNGEEAVDGQELPDRAVLRLGARGPRLVVERTARSDLPPALREMRSHGRRASPRRLLSSMRLNRRLTLGAAALVVLTAGLLIWSTWRPEPPERPAPDERLRAALEQAAASVYRVVLRTADGGEYSGATAWVVGPGRLATNAHVAKQFLQRPPGGRMQVRSSAAEPQTYDVRSVVVHPGFEAFEALWGGYQPAEGARAGRLQRIPSAGSGADVALLEVDPAAAIGVPLPLAGMETLAALTPGEPVGYVGYPSESLALSGSPVKRPIAHRQVGRITLVTNFFGASGSATSNHLIQHTCPGTGGSSGSPLLNAEGQVIGLISAGNFAPGMRGRVPSGVGINYAQRVDLLQELLDGTAESRQAARAVEWERTIEDIYPSAWRIERHRRIERHLESLSDAHQRTTHDDEYLAWTLVSTVRTDAGTSPPEEDERATVEILQAGRHLLMAVPRLQRQIELSAELVLESGTTLPVAVHRGAADFTATGPGVLRVGVHAEDRPVQVDLLLHHGQPRPLTASVLRDRVLSAWVAELEGRPYLGVEVDPTLLVDERRRLGDAEGAVQAWRRALECPADGLILVLAVAAENRPITLALEGVAGRPGGWMPSLTRNGLRYKVAQGQAAAGTEVAFLVRRAAPDASTLQVTLFVWMAEARGE